MKMKALISLLLFCQASFAQAGILVTFDGTMDSYVNGPFNAGDSFSGSFELDESVTADSSGNSNRFVGAVDNFQLNIAGEIFTGGDGTLNQVTGSSDFFLVDLGGSNGVIDNTPSSGGNILTSLHFDWRGVSGAIFPDPTVMATNKTELDFGYRRVTFQFNDTFSDQVIQGAASINIGAASPVPVPASVWLLGTGLLALFGFSRKKI